jgi:uncharacterized protein (TIGR03435 family)
MMSLVSNRLSLIRRVCFVVGGFAVGWLSVSAPEDGFDRGVWAREKAGAQTATTEMKPQEFEVISIRRNLAPISSQNPPRFGPTLDGYHAINFPLIGLFQLAYVPSNMGDSGFFRGPSIVGAPEWLNGGERYDVEAKVAEADMAAWKIPTLEVKMLRAMMKAALADRMKVAVHIESKEAPVYDLVVAKNGPKFKEAQTTDVAALKERHPDGMAIPGGTVMSRGSDGELKFFGASMESLTQVLSSIAGRPVQDKTGLTGRYDFSVQIGLPPPPPQGQQLAGASVGAVDSTTSSIFTVVQEQLGLKLEPGKGTVETLVIDHVERPSEN